MTLTEAKEQIANENDFDSWEHLIQSCDSFTIQDYINQAFDLCGG